MKSHKSAIKAVYLNIIFPGLGLAYLGRWGYAVLFLFWTPLRLLLGIALINYVPLPQFLGMLELIVRYMLVYVWWVIVMYDTCTTPYELAQEHNRNNESQPVQEAEGR
ncbi:MAG: hypothetical protein CVU44_01195 [Chloroflexi bacterium HGW-Chloroflexi-6]|nr:MAG: hypothetical protein CVU44_01195 [Chloroflexi bacterium HGW-Chloroflexi-6]